MSLYTPRHFQGSEAQALRRIRDNPFATPVTAVDGALADWIEIDPPA